MRSERRSDPLFVSGVQPARYQTKQVNKSLRPVLRIGGRTGLTEVLAITTGSALTGRRKFSTFSGFPNVNYRWSFGIICR
ncbi:hypothetical protein RA28_16780 [Ruegeria sp. ANG-S4]|nr:hypothetical protein RA28_16780 [Ruegeria sp. ANG-S4]